MALQIRRGLEADRVTFAPAQGELLYTTDDKKLYIGDGTTPGGNAVGGGDIVTETVAGQFVHNQHDNLSFTYDVGTGRIIGSIPNFNIQIAATDSTVRTVNLGETIKFSGTGGAIVTSDIEGNITIDALTYSIEAVSTTGGATFRLNTALSMDTIDFIGSGSTTVTRTDANTITISSSGGGGGGGNSFETIAVAGQSDLVADSGSDILTIVAGTNITLTTNAGTDTLTIDGISSIDDLTDVTLGSMTSGETLIWTGSSFENSTLVNTGPINELAYYSAGRTLSAATNLNYNVATSTLSTTKINVVSVEADSIVSSAAIGFSVLTTGAVPYTTFGGILGPTEYTGQIQCIDLGYSAGAPGNIFVTIQGVNQDIRPQIGLYRARGTITSTQKVLTDDVLGAISFNGHNGVQSRPAGKIAVKCETGPELGQSNVPGSMYFQLTNNDSILQTVLTISSTGRFDLYGDLFVTKQINNNTIKINNNVIETIVSNANLELRTSGNGAIYLDNISINQGTIDTLDSSGITITPAVIFNSDVTVENNLVVTNKVYAEEFVSTSNVTPEISAATELAIKVGSYEWDVNANGTLQYPILSAAPSSPANGMMAIADGIGWNPLGLSNKQQMVVYLGGGWRQVAVEP